MDSVQESLLKAYSFYLRIERQMSPNTVAAYVGDVSDFFDSCPVAPSLVSGDDILGYMSSRSGDLSRRSQARGLSSLRSFFDWMVLDGERQDNPCDKVDAPKLGRYLPEVLSVEEVGDIMESVDLSTWMGLRDRAILELMYGCGLRVSEVCALKMEDLVADGEFPGIADGNPHLACRNILRNDGGTDRTYR